MGTLFGRLFIFNPFRSVTMLGLIGYVVQFLVSAFDPSALTPTGAAGAQVASLALVVLGIRRAQERATAAAAAMFQHHSDRPPLPSPAVASTETQQFSRPRRME